MQHRQYWQRRVFLLCWAAYAFAYFCRMNLAIALPAIGAELELSKAALGSIGSSFFWAYAIGQLINGYLGDRVSSRWFIGLGLSASALINLCFGFADTLSTMVLLWGLNGFFQSMLWGPIMKALAHWLPDRPIAQTAIRISTSTIAGYYLAWGLSGYLVSRLGWVWAFRAPAVVVMVFAALWLLLMRDTPASVGLSIPAPADTTPQQGDQLAPRNQPFTRIAARTGLWVLAFVCLAQGVIKEGINLWGPTLLLEIPQRVGSSALLFSLLIPTMNLVGIFLSGWITQLFRGQERPAIARLLAACSIAAAGLVMFQNSLIGSAALLAAASCFVYGANTLLLTVIPLRYQRYGLTSTVAGGLDAAAYLGAAASGILNGWLADSGGWGRVALIWCAVGLIAALLVAENHRRLVKQNVREGISG